MAGEWNLGIFALAKKARSASDESREEMLLTAILAWSLERSSALLHRFLSRALPPDLLRLRGLVDSPVRSIRVEEPKRLGRDWRWLDLVLEWSDFQVVIEAKVTAGSLGPEQLDSYHRALDADGREHVIVAISPDLRRDADRIMSGLTTRKDRTFHLSWAEVYECAASLLDEDSVDELIAYELKEAIGMAPGLKPFTGFDEQSLSALQNMKDADKRIGELFTALRGILTAPPPGGLGLEFEKTHAQDPLAFRIPSSIWDGYYDDTRRLADDVPPYTVIMGPWFRLGEKEGLYTVYLETTSTQTARLVHEFLRDRGPRFLEELRESIEGRFPAAKFSVKEDPEQVSVRVDFPLSSQVMTARGTSGDSPLVSATVEIIGLLREKLLIPLAHT